ncbi:hypothetical protein ACVWWR_001080 [Bradyrhizobium sp. LM3.2]
MMAETWSAGKHVAEHGFQATEGAENVGTHRELLGELLDDRL